MNILGCFWMAVSWTTGRISWWLHSSPLWVSLAVIAYVLWTPAINALKISLKSMTTRLPFFKKMWLFFRRSSGNSKYAPVWFSLFCGAVMVFGAVRMSHENIVTNHHVAVLKQLDNGDWAMRSDEDESLVFRPCRNDAERGVDVNGMLTQGIGYIADYARWDERGTCKSILRSDLGFWFKDKATNFEYRRIN